MNLFELADELYALRQKKQELEEQVKALNKEIESKQQQMVELMLDEEIDKFSRNGRLFYMAVKTRVSPKAGMKPKLIEWLKESEYADLVKEDVHARTLESWARELIENEELPPEVEEMLNIYDQTVINIRKA